uniref:Alpha-carbonic anhydrase domain-containing protein n=1 Tax=Syphacia muris TaxID=451379 RepID=A0A0N5AR35_9BILA
MTACIYPCILGPDFWGLINKEWKMCSVGRMQSPINIDPKVLLYDPNLTPVEMEPTKVDATLENTGQLPFVTINDSLTLKRNVNISGGPTFPYKYRLHHLTFHFGKATESERGSEHTIDKTRFPAEIQLLAYNTDLYSNFSEAMTRPHGLLAIAVIVDIGAVTNPELKRLTLASRSIRYKGSIGIIKQFYARGFLPRSTDYITYEGSLTYPGCYETVTWVLMNNPIYIREEDLLLWSEIQTEKEDVVNPAMMTSNYRPLRALNGRLLRTNISIKQKNDSLQTCLSNIYVDLGYRANPDRVIMSSNTKQRRYSEVGASNANMVYQDRFDAASFNGYHQNSYEYAHHL